MTGQLSGPPEPIVKDDGTVKVVIFPEEDRPTTQKLGVWECLKCGVETDFGVSDGELNDPYECSSCERQGPFTHAGGLSDVEVQAALRADRMWHPPSTMSDEDFGDLWDEIRGYLRDHWDASEGEIYEGLTAYVLTTWVRENLTFVPHLMLMGKTTGGKTRLLNTLSRVSYRAHVTASATPASMFRLIDGYNVSYFVSEYHGLEYETRGQLDAVVRAGQKRGEYIDRATPTNSGYEPETFDPFAHIAIATQYTPDDDIVNRCIQVRSSSANRDMPATLDEERAEDLRNRLLFARYRLLDADEWAIAEANAYEYMADRDITGRTREKLLGPLTVAHVWDRVEALEPWIDAVISQDQEAAADSEDAIVVESIRDIAFDEVGHVQTLGNDVDPFSAVEVPYSDVLDRIEDMTGMEKSATWLGHVNSRLGLETKRKSDGTVIADPDLGPKLRELCDDLNLEWARLDAHREVEELPDDEVGPGAGGCPLCGKDRTLTHRHPPGTGDRICPECATEVEDES